jgi:hypothetical protein
MMTISLEDISAALLEVSTALFDALDACELIASLELVFVSATVGVKPLPLLLPPPPPPPQPDSNKMAATKIVV